MSKASGYIGVGIGVSDLPRSTAFYTNLIGFTLQQEIRLEYIDEDILQMPGNGTMLVLMYWKDGTSNDIRNPSVKVVVSSTDVRAMVERLRAAGHPITREPTEFAGFGLIAFSTDPDGYNIEMVQPAA